MLGAKGKKIIRKQGESTAIVNEEDCEWWSRRFHRRGLRKGAFEWRTEENKGTSNARIQSEGHSWQRENQCKGSGTRSKSRKPLLLERRERQGKRPVGFSQELGGMPTNPQGS